MNPVFVNETMNTPSKLNSISHRRMLGLNVVVFVGIVFLAIASRIWLIDYPNFKPMAALILFAGFYFRQFRIVVAAVLLAMLVSDQLIGTYEWQITLAVYGSILFAGGMGWLVARRFGRDGLDARSVVGRTIGFALAALTMSTLFFLMTNFATWACWYEASWVGLAECYTAAIPFYRWTLMGDFVFSMGAIMAYHGALALVSLVKKAPGCEPALGRG